MITDSNICQPDVEMHNTGADFKILNEPESEFREPYGATDMDESGIRGTRSSGGLETGQTSISSRFGLLPSGNSGYILCACQV
jgi:hypothetical protein